MREAGEPLIKSGEWRAFNKIEELRMKSGKKVRNEELFIVRSGSGSCRRAVSVQPLIHLNYAVAWALTI